MDSRGYLDLRYTHETVNAWSLTGRAFYDVFDYHQLSFFDTDIGAVQNVDSGRARWWGAEAGASREFFNCFRFALGTEVRKSTRLGQRNYDNSPFSNYLDVEGDQLVLGAYADGRWQITQSLSLATGARWDHYNSFGNTVNPRVALIWKPREGTTLKLLYGQAFRAPNTYQLGYENATNQRANPNLQPETIQTYEAVAEQFFTKTWGGSLSVFRNDITGLIDTTDLGNGFVVFANAGDAQVTGGEAEVNARWENGSHFRASYTRQVAETADSGEQLVNSPTNLFKTQLSVPLYKDKVFGSVELLYASDRVTLTRQKTGDAWLVNATLFSHELAPGLEVSASIYNLFGQRYRTVGGTEHLQDQIEQDGRTLRVKVSYRF